MTIKITCTPGLLAWPGDVESLLASVITSWLRCKYYAVALFARKTRHKLRFLLGFCDGPGPVSNVAPIKDAFLTTYLCRVIQTEELLSTDCDEVGLGDTRSLLQIYDSEMACRAKC
jgi:hypothetical protein